MLFANLVFSGRDWLWLTASVLAVALVLLIWSYWRAGAAPVRWTCLLRFVPAGTFVVNPASPAWRKFICDCRR